MHLQNEYESSQVSEEDQSILIIKAEICFGLGPKPKKRIQNRTIDIYILFVHEYCITLMTLYNPDDHRGTIPKVLLWQNPNFHDFALRVP